MVMAKKKEQKEMLQVALDKHKWINTPVVYSSLGERFTSLQQDVMLMVSGQLQDNMKQFFDENRYKSKENPKSIFTAEQLSQGLKTVRIQLSALEVGDCNYAWVEQSLDALRDLWIKAPVFNQQTGILEAYQWMPVFKSILIPKRFLAANGQEYKVTDFTRREGFLDIEINELAAPYVFDMSRGYVNHLERIALFSHSSYTSRIYMLLMVRLSRGQTNPAIPYLELREHLGMIKRTMKSNEIIETYYNKFSEFRKRVLDVAQKDMLRLKEELKTEITFTYEPVYRGTTKRGNPEAVRFHIQRTPLGLAREAQLHRPAAEGKLIGKLLNDYPDLERKTLHDLFALVSDNNWEDFKQYAYKEISKAVKEPHRWGGTVESYVVFLLKNRIATYDKPAPTAQPDLFAQAEAETKAREQWAHCAQDLSAAIPDEQGRGVAARLAFGAWNEGTRTLTLHTDRATMEAIEGNKDLLEPLRQCLTAHYGKGIRLNYMMK